jgi:hypothetical protein
MALINAFRRGLNTAADISGATSAVKVGGNLAQNTVRTLQRRPRKPLYTPQTNVAQLLRDALGIVGIGSAAMGGVAGMAGRGAAQGGAAIPGGTASVPPPFSAVEGNPIVQNTSHIRALVNSARALKALREALRVTPK